MFFSHMFPIGYFTCLIIFAKEFHRCSSSNRPFPPPSRATVSLEAAWTLPVATVTLPGASPGKGNRSDFSVAQGPRERWLPVTQVWLTPIYQWITEENLHFKMAQQNWFFGKLRLGTQGTVTYPQEG